MRPEIESILTKKAGEIYRAIVDNVDVDLKPHEFVRNGYKFYGANYESMPSVNGRIFELLICDTLIQQGLIPFYYQAKFVQVPNVEFDVVCYHPKYPVALSIKTSLRERYKQADLESLALRQVYRNAKCYLLTMSDEYYGIQQKIGSGDVFGLTDCLRADSPIYDDLLNELKKQTFQLADPVIPITGSPVPSI